MTTSGQPIPWREQPWGGVFPATLCAFHKDESIDKRGLKAYFAELAAVDGGHGLTCNGHTGGIMSLRPAERARVVRFGAEAVQEERDRSGRIRPAVYGGLLNY